MEFKPKEEPLGITYLWRVLNLHSTFDGNLGSDACQIASQYDPGQLGQIITDLEPLVERFATDGKTVVFEGMYSPQTLLIDLLSDLTVDILWKSGSIYEEASGAFRKDYDRFERVLEDAEEASMPPLD